MARKTPKYLLSALEKFEQRQRHYANCLRIKREVPAENQALHILEKAPEFYEGMAQGNLAVMEDLLHEAGCYRGFCYINEDGTRRVIGQNGPDWLVRFYH